jgi:hypothetical protein
MPGASNERLPKVLGKIGERNKLQAMMAGNSAAQQQDNPNIMPPRFFLLAQLKRVANFQRELVNSGM